MLDKGKRWRVSNRACSVTSLEVLRRGSRAGAPFLIVIRITNETEAAPCHSPALTRPQMQLAQPFAVCTMQARM